MAWRYGRFLGVWLRLADVAAGLCPCRDLRARGSTASAARSASIPWCIAAREQRPGLVLGLDRGGSCVGLAFRVPGELRDEVVAYLRERELVTSVYLERLLPVRLASGETVIAVCYVVDRTHEQYAGSLSVDEAANDRCRQRRPVRPQRGISAQHRRASQGARHSRPLAGRASPSGLPRPEMNRAIRRNSVGQAFEHCGSVDS